MSGLSPNQQKMDQIMHLCKDIHQFTATVRDILRNDPENIYQMGARVPGIMARTDKMQKYIFITNWQSNDPMLNTRYANFRKNALEIFKTLEELIERTFPENYELYRQQ